MQLIMQLMSCACAAGVKKQALSCKLQLKCSSSAAHELQLSCTRILDEIKGLSCTELHLSCKPKGRVDLRVSVLTPFELPP